MKLGDADTFGDSKRRDASIFKKGMPLRKRHLPLLLMGALAAGVGFGVGTRLVSAQDKPKAAPAKAGKQQTPDLAVPGAEAIVIMIRTTLLSLNDAMSTGNYTVLRDLAAPSFREANNAARLGQIFSGLTARSISLSSVAILVPKLPNTPNIDAKKHLNISGYFHGDPIQIDFDLQFEAVSGRWRLFGLSVRPVNPTKVEGHETAKTKTPASPAAKKSNP